MMIVLILKSNLMNNKQPIELRQLNENLRYSESQSSVTDYGDNPHVYNNKWQYIMSAVGVCVGFGAFWRFPYLVYKNGGGVFLIPYLISMLIFGMPLLYLQTSIGQMHRVSIPHVFKKIHPSLKILGLAIMTATFHFSTSYNILLAYCYRFMFTSFEYPLPFADQSITQNDYFHNEVLKMSDSISSYQAINPFMFIIYIGSMILCHYVIKNGAKTSGQVVIITATTPFVIFFILVLRGLFLNGALQGIIFLFKPKWEMLWNYSIWVDATTQVFYQLSIGIGTIVNLSTAKARRQDIMQSVLIVPAGLVLCGLLSALTIFIYLSHFCIQSGYSIDDPSLQLSGLQLSFNVLPKALLLLPMANLWLFIFFFTMVLLGIDSEFGLMEAIYCYVRDQFEGKSLTFCGVYIDGQKAKIITLVLLCAASPLLTSHAGIYWLGFFDYFMSNIPFTVWVLLELYFFVHVFPFSEMANAIHRYTKVSPPAIIKYCLTSYWLPGLLIANLIFSIYNQLFVFQRYPIFYGLLGWLFSLYPMIIIWWKLIYKKQWPGWNQLKLTFAEIQNRPSYF